MSNHNIGKKRKKLRRGNFMLRMEDKREGGREDLGGGFLACPIASIVVSPPSLSFWLPSKKKGLGKRVQRLNLALLFVELCFDV
ncbi:hypothetical protein Nepgr_001229 [Nepenthes gracilis]|uniref:Uncharacterized protein n=1 Tax=Nepenthes gracilis TaxID=150966 RepID=A0AAD3RXL4_NEPGR|nr:hypothetical protein Nepgr_001229 [Nepenthes gracilis]